MAKIRNNKGFSLIELMVVIGIVAILGAIGIPSMISWLQNKGIQSAARDMYSNLRKAQSVAVKNNRNCAISFDGNTGYTVYVDENKDYKHDAAVEPTVVKVLWSQYRDVQLKNVNFDSTPGSPTMAFQPNLIPSEKVAGAVNRSIKLQNSKARTADITIIMSGHISLKWL